MLIRQVVGFVCVTSITVGTFIVTAPRVWVTLDKDEESNKEFGEDSIGKKYGKDLIAPFDNYNRFRWGQLYNELKKDLENKDKEDAVKKRL